MGNGHLFLTVKAEIRKKINKKEGDLVHVILYSDESPIVVPDEIIECFRNEPKEIFETFLSYTEGNPKAYLDWINEARTDKTKVERTVSMMNRLQKKLKFYDREE